MQSRALGARCEREIMADPFPPKFGGDALA
jgi:hypothetical protein